MYSMQWKTRNPLLNVSKYRNIIRILFRILICLFLSIAKLPLPVFYQLPIFYQFLPIFFSKAQRSKWFAPYTISTGSIQNRIYFIVVSSVRPFQLKKTINCPKLYTITWFKLEKYWAERTSTTSIFSFYETAIYVSHLI